MEEPSPMFEIDYSEKRTANICAKTFSSLKSIVRKIARMERRTESQIVSFALEEFIEHYKLTNNFRPRLGV